MGLFKDFPILTNELNPFKKLLIKESLLASRDQLLKSKQVKPIPPPIILIPFPEVATNVFRIMTDITKLISVTC